MFIGIKFLPTEIKELIGCELKNYEPKNDCMSFGYTINGCDYDLTHDNWESFRAAEEIIVQKMVEMSEVVQTLITTFKLEYRGYIDHDADGNPCVYILLESDD